MGLFKHKADPFSDGVRTTATVERVHDTGAYHSHQISTEVDHGGMAETEVFIVFRLADGTLLERDFLLGDHQTPRPGSRLQVAYLPDDMAKTFEFDRQSSGDPDPAIPRGWSQGVFELEPLGSVCTAVDHTLDAQRNLFRTGRRTEAKVVRHDVHPFGNPLGTVRVTLTLRFDDTEVDTDVFIKVASYLPEPAATIQIAVGQDGAIALDTDERFYLQSAQLLIWAAPPAASPREQAERLHDAGQMSDKAYQNYIAALDGAAAHPVTVENPARHAQLAAMEQLRDSGKMTAEQFEAMKARLLNS